MFIPAYLQQNLQSRHLLLLEQKPMENVWVDARSVQDPIDHAVQTHTHTMKTESIVVCINGKHYSNTTGKR